MNIELEDADEADLSGVVDDMITHGIGFWTSYLTDSGEVRYVPIPTHEVFE